MFWAIILFASFTLCRSHAVVPVAQHVPLVAPYPVHGYAGHGLLGGYGGHGWAGSPLAHHILKRSPHFVAPLAHGAHLGAVAHLAPVAHIAPVAVSHQARLDVRTSPAVAASVLPIVKPVVAPALHAVPLLHKSLIAAPLHYGVGHYAHHAQIYPHLGHF